MVRRLSALIAGLLLVLVPATSAAAAPQGAAKTGGGTRLVVKVLAPKVQLNTDGTVSVPVKVRCSPPLDAFELDVSVRQSTAFGSTTLLGTPFPACTGAWERTTVTVSAETGTFAPGAATVDVFLGAFDPVSGSDVSAETSAGVTL
jgi:hypothetical protein